jgi:hypothetical protein
LPKKAFYRIYRRGKTPSRFYFDYADKFSFISDNSALIVDLGLPVDIHKLKSNGLLSPLIISMGFFLSLLDSKITF